MSLIIPSYPLHFPLILLSAGMYLPKNGTFQATVSTMQKILEISNCCFSSQQSSSFGFRQKYKTIPSRQMCASLLNTECVPFLADSVCSRRIKREGVMSRKKTLASAFDTSGHCTETFYLEASKHSCIMKWLLILITCRGVQS